MVVGKVSKAPDEKVNYSIDFSARLLSCRKCTLASITVEDINGKNVTEELIASDPAPYILDGIVTFRCKGGTMGNRYSVFVAVTLPDGQVIEAVLGVEITQ